MKAGWIMLGITVFLYLLTAFFNTQIALNSLEKSFEIVISIAPIIIVVLVLMAAFTVYAKSKNIIKHIGEGSGIKGWSIAIFGGVLSHGSTYIWYPLLSQMKDSGAREGLIVAFFYARAIKLPWIPVMIAYFGVSFTVLLSVYIILGSLVQGIIADQASKLCKADAQLEQ